MTDPQTTGHEEKADPPVTQDPLRADPAASSSREPPDEPWVNVEREQNERSERLASDSLEFGYLAWFFVFTVGTCTFSEIFSGVIGGVLAACGVVATFSLAIYGLLMGIRGLTAEGRQGRRKAIAGVSLNAALLLAFAIVFWIWILK